MRIIIGIGGNALLQRGQPPEITTQRLNIKYACESIAELAQDHEIIITHGNGPQVGLLALQAAAYKEVTIYPFDVLGAESQGMIGYLLIQELMNQLPKKKVIALLTQIEVNVDDPAFLQATKFVGPVYTEEQIKILAKERHWQFAQDGQHFRRVVPSPLPQRILEITSIQSLVNLETIVICAGGGGIPVVRNSTGHYSGVEAVIDKDFATALLAEQLQADRILLTDVANVVKNWGKSTAESIGITHFTNLEKVSFASGSMEPKVKAACQFVRNTKGIAHIGLLSEAQLILQQMAGTTILP